jgi:WD40 repeat protein
VGELEAQAAGNKHLLAKSASAILSVAVSSDGRRIAAGCLDKTLRVWTLNKRMITAGVSADEFGADSGLIDTGSFEVVSAAKKSQGT